MTFGDLWAGRHGSRCMRSNPAYNSCFTIQKTPVIQASLSTSIAPDSRTSARSTPGASALPLSAGNSEHLRIHTRAEHARLERVPMLAALLDAQVDLHDVRQALQALWGFFSVMEQRLEAWLQPVAERGWHYGPRRGELERDLCVLGVNARQRAHLPTCDAVPGVDSLEHALGCMYVSEGSRLGAPVVGRRLRTRLPPLDFFHMDTQQSGRRWRAFAQFLDRQSPSGEARRQRGAAAAATFSHLHAWLNDYRPKRRR